jgi:hypothetical protein
VQTLFAAWGEKGDRKQLAGDNENPGSKVDSPPSERLLINETSGAAPL